MNFREQIVKYKKEFTLLLMALALYLGAIFLPFAVFLFHIPLALANEKKSLKFKQLSLSVFYIIIIGSFLLNYYSFDIEQRSLMLGVLLTGSLIPLMLLIATTIWVLFDWISLRYRYVLSLVGPGILLFLLLLFLNSKQVGALLFKEQITLILQNTLKTLTDNPASIDILSKSVLNSFANTTLMITSFVIGVTEFLILYFSNRKSEVWQKSITQWDLDFGFLVALLGSWSMALASILVDLPYIVEVISFNLALTMSLLYAIKGISILAFFFSKRGGSSSRYFFIIGALMILPPANAVIALILVLLGAADTWLTIRNKKGDNNENYTQQ